MSTLARRLDKLEPKAGHGERFEEVSLRLMRYAIERKFISERDGPNGFPGSPHEGEPGGAAFEEIYERSIKTHPRYAEMLGEVEAGQFIYCVGGWRSRL